MPTATKPAGARRSPWPDHSGHAAAVPRNDRTRTQTHGADRRRAEGPPLVLLAGVAGDHSDLELLVPWPEPYVSPQLPRRSRHGLDDDSSRAIERDFQRLAAALDAIGGPVDAFAQGFDATPSDPRVGGEVR